METKILLLLVEDEALLGHIFEDSLKEAGFELETVPNGQRALSALDARGDAIRGIITDVNLGKGTNGWDVARHARELIPAVPVVYMSGASGHEWTSQGVPGSTFLAKPFAPAQLVTAISTLLNSSTLNTSLGPQMAKP